MCTKDLQFRFWQGTKMEYSGAMCCPGFQEWVDQWTQGHIQDDTDLMPVMQMTVLKDKDGKEIYFDDIVEFSFHDKESGEEYSGTALIVQTIGGGAGIRHEWSEHIQELVAIQNGGIQEDIWEDENLWTFSVIGNMHETPHLLMDNGAGLPHHKK